MELRHLRYFQVVAEEGHITRASERLSMRQPPLSLQIKALERELGVQLFRRLPRGVELTDAGATFYTDVCALLAGLDQAVAKTQRVARGEAGHLALGFTSSVIAHPAVKLAIKAYRAAYPDVTLNLTEDGSSDLVDALDAYRLDVAFIRSDIRGHAPIRQIKLIEEPVVLACPEGLPLAAEDGPVPIEDIAGQPLVLYRRTAGPKLYDRIIAWFEAQGFEPQIIQEAPRVDTALNLVAAGMGVTVVPRSLAAAHLEGVHYREIVADPPMVEAITLVARKSDPSLALRNFIKTVQSQMSV
ncbi:MAG: LysR family transcriptional regulator [Pseudomonadota bacterium]